MSARSMRSSHERVGRRGVFRAVHCWWCDHQFAAWGMLAALAGLLVVTMFALPAIAGTEDLVPDGSGALTQWTVVGGGTGTTAVQVAGDSSYIEHTNRNNAGSVQYTLQDSTRSLSIAITAVDIIYTASASNTTRGLSLTPSVGGTSGTTHTRTSMTAAFATYSYLNVPRPGGGAWTVSDINDLSVLVTTPAPGANGTYVRVDQIIVRVTYDETEMPTLTVAQGTDDMPVGSRPVTLQYAQPGTSEVVVDQVALTASNGDVDVTTIRVRGRDTVDTLDTDVALAQLYLDDGTDTGLFDASDTYVGDAVFSGSTGDGSVFAEFSGAPLLTVATATTQKLWIVYDIGVSASDSHVVGARLQYSETMLDSDVQVEAGQYVEDFGVIQSAPASTGQTIRIDAVPPAITLNAPVDSNVLTGMWTAVEGVASDAGSGVRLVEVRIARSDGAYYDDSTGSFVFAETWNEASGTSAWSLVWSFTPGDDRDFYYAIDARVTDGIGLITYADSVNVQVDNVGPSIGWAVAVSPTEVWVYLSEPIDPSTVEASDFTIDDLAIYSATVLSGNERVSLTTEVQTPGPPYTVSTTDDVFTDVYGNGSIASWAEFTGHIVIEDEEPPTTPQNVSGTGGAVPPVIARLTWSAAADNVGVAGYRIYRSTSATGTFSPVGETTSLSFNDTTGFAGEEYWYQVSAFDAAGNESVLSAPVGPFVAIWLGSPHVTYTREGSFCALCHVPHVAAPDTQLLRQTDSGSRSLGVCYSCHDGTGASLNVLDGPVNSFGLASGHALEDIGSGGDLTDTCGGCHDSHRDYAENRLLPRQLVNGVRITAPDNSWCLACHNDANDWYGPGYPDVSEPLRDSQGYPVTGTFAGRTVYEDGAANPHATIPTSTVAPERHQGDCLYCHAAHGSSSQYDSLVATFTPPTPETYLQDQVTGAFATLCFGCHGGKANYAFPTPPDGARDIEQFYTSANSRAGHRIKTAGGNLPAGSPLPCYNCHNPHGSSRGNASSISDERGADLSTAGAVGVRRFCFTCHSSSDAVPSVWNSVAAAYEPVGEDSVEGLRRDGSLPAGNVLRLPDIDGHAVGDSQSCYVCHGQSYDAGGHNVHDPGAGVSAGGQPCFSCHAYTDMQSSSSYHHYLSSDDATPYPMSADPASLATNDSRRTCLTCHVDHDYFGTSNTAAGHTKGLAQNFRSSVAVQPDRADGSTYVNYDYWDLDPGDGGVCTSCHKVQMDKNTTGRKSDTDRGPRTVPVSQDIFALSAHNYFATAPDFMTEAEAAVFATDGSGFMVNCGKCHNDTLAKQFQSGTYQFGLHDSPIQSLLTDANQTDYPEQPGAEMCFLCHSRAIDSAPRNPLGGTSYADSSGTDIYGGGLMMGLMNSDALNIKGMFSHDDITSRHPVSGDGAVTSRVMCENCHNPHKTEADLGFGGPSGVVQDPENTLVGSMTDGSHVYYGVPTTSAELATNREFCLACHDGAPPTYVNDGTAYVPYDVFVRPERASAADKSTYLGRGHANALPAATSPGASTIEATCATCHDKHGSRYPNLLGVSSAPDADPTIAAHAITGNNNTVCEACHASATPEYPAALRDATGYPVRGTFPGMAVYLGSNGLHTSTDSVWPGSAYAGGDCKNCHDVHGTANVYDQLRGTFASDDFAVCFACHDGSIAAAMDIARYYPDTNGGSAVQTAESMYGHRIVSPDGNLAPGDGLPCYSCHNPHGTEHAAHGLLVVSQNDGAPLVIGDAAGEIDLTTAHGVRRFCFSCHTSADATPQGTAGSGAGYVDVTGVALVEGISRTADRPLRLPPLAGHYVADTDSCYGCHGSDYSSATSNNVHNPGITGASRASHTALNDTSVFACGECHKDGRLNADDEIWIEQSQLHYAGEGCGRCHPSPVDLNVLPSGKYPECESCHTIVGDVYHMANAQFTATHTAQALLPECTAYCHTDDIIGSHEAYVAAVNEAVPGPAPETQYTTCQLCHSSASFGIAAGLTGGRLRDTATKPWTENDGDIYLRPGDRANWQPLKSGNTRFSQCDNCHFDPHGIDGYGGTLPDITDLHAADLIGTVGGVTYTDSRNVGCFAGCHTTNLLYEHLDSGFAASWSAEIAGRTFAGNGTDCGRCHTDMRSDLGVVGDTAYLPAVQNAIRTGDRRCDSCHNGKTTEGDPDRGLRTPHSTNRVLNTPTFGNYAGLPPLGTSIEFQNWPAGGGHNAMGTAWPKTQWIGTFNGVTNPQLSDTVSPALKPGWTAGSRVLCSDCHLVEPANGPHGASVPYGIVPYTDRTGRTAVAGDWFNGTGPYAINNTNENNAPGTGLAMSAAPRGLCDKCHGVWAGGFHDNNNHRTGTNMKFLNQYGNGSCVSCHVRIPHGWKRPRLLRRVAPATIAGIPEDTQPYAFTSAERPGVYGIRINTTLGSLTQNDCSENSCGNSFPGSRHSGSTPYWP